MSLDGSNVLGVPFCMQFPIKKMRDTLADLVKMAKYINYYSSIGSFFDIVKNADNFMIFYKIHVCR